MRNFSLLFLCLIFSWGQLSAQIDDGWVEAGNSAYNSKLLSIEFTSNDVGFAVGSGGAFLKTTNGGLTWTAYSTGFPYHFREIFFLNAEVGYLAGNRLDENDGRLLRTSDGGVTWQEVFAVDGYMFFSVYFYNENVGFLGTFGYYKTVDGGQTWTHNNSIFSNVKSFYFKDLNNGFLTAEENGAPAGGYKTTDGGINWDEFETEACQQIYFVDNTTGYLLTNNSPVLKKTTNGGATWNPTAHCQLGFVKKCVFKDAMNGIVIGNLNGHISRTTDGGASWTVVQNQTDYDMYGLGYKPNGDYYACGQSGRIRKSGDNGANWTQVAAGQLHHRINKVCFTNDSTLFGVGNAGLLVKSTDRGTSWSTLNPGVTTDLLGIWAVSPATLFIVGTQNTLLKSVNGGATWQPSNTGFSSGTDQFGDIRFIDGSTGFAGVTNLYKTTNGGDSWAPSLSPAQPPIFDMSFPDPDTLYVRSKYNVYRSVNGGGSWTKVADDFNLHHCGIDFLDPHTGITGDNYDVVRTNNAGASWTYLYPDHIGRVSDVKMKSANSYTFVGWEGAIQNTEDGGVTWAEVISGTTRDLYILTYGPDGTGYILGDDGLLLRQAVVPTFTLTFAVENVQGDPVPDASITLNGAPYPAGQYVFPGLLPGVYDWSISGPGYCAQTGSSNVVEDTQEEIVLSDCFEVVVEVTNVFGQPVPEAEVTLGAGAAQTNAAGTAEFELGQVGDLSLQVAAGGYVTYATIVTIQGDIVIPVVLAADLAAPLANSASDILDHSFVANWQLPANADSCLLYVSGDGFVTHIPGFSGKALTGSQAEVTGLDSGTLYGFRVKSKNVYGLSEYSNTVEVTTTTTATVEAPGQGGVLLFPNPAGDWLDVHAPGRGNAAVEILSEQGMVLLRREATLTFEGSWRIDISQLPAGVYILRIIGDPGGIGKFVKR